MSRTTRTMHTTPALAAFALGEPVRPIGFLPNGRPVFPIAGGAPDDPPADPPEGVTPEEWDALGDPGKRAIVRERARADDAERRAQAATARPTPPKPRDPEPLKPAAPAGGQQGDQPDVAALIQQAVAEAVKPFQEAEEQRQVQAKAEAAGRVLVEAAKPHLLDPTDALAHIDLTPLLGADGTVSTADAAKAVEQLKADKPHLAKSTVRTAPPGIGGGAPATATEAEKVAAAAAQMYKATGARPPAAPIAAH